MNAYQGRAIRLTLKTQELSKHPLAAQRTRLAEKATPQIGWLAPRIESFYPEPKELPPIKRLMIWSIDGLKLEPLIYHPELREAFPSFKMLMSKSINFSRVWSDNAQQVGGHQLLLKPTQDQASLIATTKSLSGWSAYIGSTNVTQPQIDDRFDVSIYVDPQELDEHPYQESLMQIQQMTKLGELLQERVLINTRFSSSTQTDMPPELIYIHTPLINQNKRGLTYSLSPIEKAWLEQTQLSEKQSHVWAQYFSRLKKLDYSLSQLLSELHTSSLTQDTALLITGTMGLPTRLNTVSPSTLMQHTETSALLYHPQLDSKRFSQLNQKSEVGTVLERTHLSALHSTINAILFSNGQLPHSEANQHGSISPYLLNQVPLPAFVDQAQKNGHFIVRMGNYYLFERPIGQPTLWEIHKKMRGSALLEVKDISSQAPILLRTLRDGINLSSLVEGLK